MRSASLSKTLTAATLFLALLAAAVGRAQAPPTMPDFSLPSATDDGVVASSHHQGKVLLINFWATWCGPCREEIPDLVRLHDSYKGKGFTVIGISLDDSRRVVRRFVQRLGIPYPMAMGNSKTARAFGGVFGVPQSFLVDRKGRIVKSYMGLTDPGNIERDITALLGD